MERLVHTHNRLPADVTAEERERLRTAERARAMELRAEGVLKKLWRTPGKPGTVALYECQDATHLHDTLSSLPMFPWLEVSVEPLATHAQELQAANGQSADGSSDVPGGHNEGHDEQPV